MSFVGRKKKPGRVSKDPSKKTLEKISLTPPAFLELNQNVKVIVSTLITIIKEIGIPNNHIKHLDNNMNIIAKTMTQNIKKIDKTQEFE